MDNVEMDPIVAVPEAAPAKVEKPEGMKASDWQKRIDKSKRKREDLITGWKKNIDYRRGKFFDSDSDEDRIAVTMDWALTKSKQAQLYSQTPVVVATPKHPAFAAATPIFTKKLNEELTRAKVGVAMDECLPDVINASGVAAVFVAYESRRVTKMLPAIDTSDLPVETPEDQAAIDAVPMEPVPSATDARFITKRISPEDLLWDTTFTGSDFDDAGWLGYSGRMTWTMAVKMFGDALNEENKEEVLGQRSESEKMNSDPMRYTKGVVPTDEVNFDEIFYWAYRYDPEQESYKAIHRLVFVNGIEEPVIDEPWEGQRLNPKTGKYVGACKLPIRVLTLTYISNEAIPPSDTAIGRPQVEELIAGRTHMVLQRRHSQPMRWHNTDRLDPTVADLIRRGEWQMSIPVQGSGENVLGEVARSTYPPENIKFDDVAHRDLYDQWQVGGPQMGGEAKSGTSATEASIAQRNFQTRIGYERARVGAFFIGIAEVFAGLLQLFGDFETDPMIGPDGLQRLNTWDRLAAPAEFIFTIRPDATVLLDANQRIQRIKELINDTGQSGFVNLEPLIRERVELAGGDPELVMVKPQPKAPDTPNMGYSFKGEDLTNPLVVALILSEGKPPTPEHIAAAKMMILEAHTGVAAPPVSPENQTDSVSKTAGGPQAPKPQGGPKPPMIPNGPQNPDFNTQPRINKRDEAGEGHGA